MRIAHNVSCVYIKLYRILHHNSNFNNCLISYLDLAKCEASDCPSKKKGDDYTFNADHRLLLVMLLVNPLAATLCFPCVSSLARARTVRSHGLYAVGSNMLHQPQISP